MSKDTELLQLEQFVEKLLKKFSALKTERDGLLQNVAEKEEVIAGHELTIEEKDKVIAARDKRIGELEAQVSAKDSERSEISNKVNSIMEQIESWELSLEEGEGTEGKSGAAQKGGGKDNSSKKDKGGQSDDGRMQHDLF